MGPLHEHHEGTARLVSRDNPAREYAIPHYRYDHFAQLVDKGLGLPPVLEHRSTIVIMAPDSIKIPEGYYVLHTEEEIIYVKNLGFAGWHVVSGP